MRTSKHKTIYFFLARLKLLTACFPLPCLDFHLSRAEESGLLLTARLERPGEVGPVPVTVQQLRHYNVSGQATLR